MNLEGSSEALDLTVREFAKGQKLVNRYTLKQILGRGGMGIVWLARDDVLERDVALKFLPELILFDRAMLNELKRETNRSLELTHKNIVRIYDFVHDEASGCISMEYIDGDTLSNMRIDRPNKVFECWELDNWTKQLCEALDYAHNHAHVVHRDLKPANLMVNQRGELKVADFGIARSVSEAVSMLTMGKHTSGTLVYMSPQQLDGGRSAPLDDVYSVGATLYELLTSKPPFYSGNVDRQIHERIPPSMKNRREELDVAGEPIDQVWEDVVAACLQKDPALRPQSALEIVEFLTVPAPKTSRKMSGWLGFPSRKPDQKTAQWPTPPSRKTRPATEGVYRPPTTPARTKTVRPKRESTHPFRRTGLAIAQAFRGATLGIGRSVNTVFAGATHGTAVFGRSIVNGSISVANAAGAAVIALLRAFGALVRGVAIALFVIGRETLRGSLMTVIPAAVAAATIWFFAIRTPPPKKIVNQPPRAQPSLPAPPQPTMAPPVVRTDETPTAPPQGGMLVDTVPGGATIIIDGGSIVKKSPVGLSDLPVGQHHVQIVMDGYMTEEREVDIKQGEVASQGSIALRPRMQPQLTPVPTIATETVSKATENTEQKVVASKKPARPKPPVAAPTKKSTPLLTRQATARTPPSKTIKPTSTPQQKAQRPFEGGVPGD